MHTGRTVAAFVFEPVNSTPTDEPQPAAEPITVPEVEPISVPVDEPELEPVG